MAEPVITIIFDFDDTLGVDTISYLLKENHIKPAVFWDEIDKLVKNGYDPPLAYMNRLLDLAKHNKLDLRKEYLKTLGKKLPIFPGLPKAFSELREFVSKHKTLKNARVKIEYYIVSGGLEEIIRGSKIGNYMNGIFGCNFAYHPKNGLPIAIKTAVSFTEKTRYVFAINKGISESDAKREPYRINDAMDYEKRRIPWEQMLYIGDGPSDIPCLSLVTKNHGSGIGASSPMSTFKKGYELARGKRITVGPYTADYSKGTDMWKALEEIILKIGLEILENKKKSVVSAPTHS